MENSPFGKYGWKDCEKKEREETMKKTLRRMIAAALAACLLCGMCATASAADGFKYPSSYWPLHEAWDAAVAAQDPDQVISVAQQTYDLLNPLGLGMDVCENLEPKCSRASWCSEMKGDIAGAIRWMERQRVFAEWLDQNKHSYKDTLLAIDARMVYLKAAQDSKIYVLTDQAGNSYPGSGAPASGTLYGSAVTGTQSGESAVLMYVTFGDSYGVDYWINYYKDTNPKFAQAAQGDVIELAWNFSPEGTAGAQAVLAADSYISDSLAAIGSLNATVLLRLGAEMSSWNDCDPATYIQAFQKVAQAAKRYSNIKMVFSPNDISNRNVTFADFYPGDQYVDWIGVSTYHNTNYTGSVPAYTFDAQGYGDDAYYNRGIYDRDPLLVLQSLAAFAQEHGKPMMISECGFSYQGDLASFAASQLNWFYSYVNMVYPQVKAVFYFDHDPDDGQYDYALSGSTAAQSAYRSAIANNGAYLAQGQTSGKTWKPLSAVSSASETLKLAAYASLPGKDPISATYYVDGNAVKTLNTAPFYFELDPSTLSSGKHTVQAKFSAGKFTSQTPAYELTVAGGPAKPSAWAQALVQQAEEKKLVTERTDGDYQDQITRLQFAELAVNLIEQAAGQPIQPAGASFTDTSDPAVLKAVAAGVTSGKGENTFAPEDKITRQEICVMLNKVIQYVDQVKGTTTLTNTSTQLDAKFTDGGEIASWASNAVALLTNNGLMSGKGEGKVAPLANTTIEEAIVLALALYNKF